MTTSLITDNGGALTFDAATWPAALRWLNSNPTWRTETTTYAAGQRPRIKVSGPLPPEIELPEREMEVLNGMSEGKSNAEIGDGMYLSEDTIKTYAGRLFRHLGARDRAHAVAIAFRTGILGGLQ